MLHCDVSLLKSGIARQDDGLHPIQQWWRNRIKAVCSRDEKNLAQVDRNIDVMICECVILFGIKDLKHSSRGIAVEV